MGSRGTRPTSVETGGELDDTPDAEEHEEDDASPETGNDDEETAGDGEGESGDDDDDDDDEEATFASLTPAQRRAVEARLARSNANGAKWRRRATGKDKEWRRPPTPGDVPPRKPAEPKAPAELDAAGIRASVMEELRAERQRERVATTAERELETAGLVLPRDKAGRSAALAKALRLLDLDDLEPDDVAEEVAQLRRTMPGLFRAKGTRRTGVVGPAGAGRRSSGTKLQGLDGVFDA